MVRCALCVFGCVGVVAGSVEEADAKGFEEAKKMGMVACVNGGGNVFEGGRFLVNVRGEWVVDVVGRADAFRKFELKVMELKEKYPNLNVTDFYFVCE